MYIDQRLATDAGFFFTRRYFMNESQLQHAWESAKAAREHSYSPFSAFKVGAAVVCEGTDAVFAGCNVENSSYGGTICAERSAVVSAVSSVGKIALKAVVVVTDAPTLTVPCAICLQFMAEFSTDDTLVYLADLEGIKASFTFKELLPKPFRFRP
ncbi:MAG: cytidine deaminase [Spirochaetales bacterium]|nr:cytidine deaminase [Spirochaetales bacterium]